MTKCDYSLAGFQRPTLAPPNGEKKILLHTCCAPCSGEIMQALSHSKIETLLYFYNPNIHPDAEYIIRKDENKRYADKLGMAFIDADYDKDNWFERTKGQENDPERGRRCSTCFDMRFEKTAQYAHNNNFSLISSTLGISRWKDFNQINHCGNNAVLPYKNLQYWDLNWRKKGGSSRMLEISKQETFYQQEYCGCVYSLRDTNKRLLKQGKNRINRGIKFYK